MFSLLRDGLFVNASQTQGYLIKMGTGTEVGVFRFLGPMFQCEKDLNREPKSVTV